MTTDHSELAAALLELAAITETNPDKPVYVGTDGVAVLRRAADVLEALTVEPTITDEECVGESPTLTQLRADPRLAALDKDDNVWQYNWTHGGVLVNGSPLPGVTTQLPQVFAPYRWAEHEAGDPQ